MRAAVFPAIIVEAFCAVAAEATSLAIRRRMA